MSDDGSGPPVLSSPRSPSATTRRRMATNQWHAFGTTVSVAVTDSEHLTGVRAACDDVLGALYATLSPHEESDLVRANRAAGAWVPVDPLLVRLLTAAGRVGTVTSGLIPESDGWARTGIDTEGAIQVRPGHELDLSPLAKAFAADLVVGVVPDRTGASLIVSVGNHIAVGRPAGAEPHRWQVGVSERPLSEQEAQRARVTGGATDRAGLRRQAALRRADRAADPGRARLGDLDRPNSEIVGLESGALATSSASTPRRRLRTTSDYQLLSPGKGSALDPLWHTASVCAPACVDACGASLAAIALGEQAPAWLWEHDLPARLVAADGRVLRLSGWPSR
jgi:FAD:protein FMN transferase